MYLRKQGFRVLQADDAERGLEYIERERPKLAIVDVGLPGEMDGLDVCRKLRAEHGPPVVLLDRARRRGRPGPRARARSRRLRDEALLAHASSSPRVRAVLRRTEGTRPLRAAGDGDRCAGGRHRPARSERR